MYFKRKKEDLRRSGDGTLFMDGGWYDTQEDAEDEDKRPWLHGQVKLPISDPKHATVELMEEQIAKEAERLAPGREAQLAPESLDDALPKAVKDAFGRGKAVDTTAIRERVRGRREAARERGRS